MTLPVNEHRQLSVHLKSQKHFVLEAIRPYLFANPDPSKKPTYCRIRTGRYHDHPLGRHPLQTFSLVRPFGGECRNVFQYVVLGSMLLNRFDRKCDIVAHFLDVPVVDFDPFLATRKFMKTTMSGKNEKN